MDRLPIHMGRYEFTAEKLAETARAGKMMNVPESSLRLLCVLLNACLAIALCCSPLVTSAADPLAEGFRSPPHIAKPLVWWHWMNGNVTFEGVRADFEWMKRVGIGGVQNFDASIDTPKLVEKPLNYLTPEWRRTFGQSVRLANRLGLEFDIESTPGWSVTGGPWVQPNQAMKKLVWNETLVEGGKPFKGRLAQPPIITGPFQNMSFTDFIDKKVAGLPVHYADAAVIAYRIPAAELLGYETEPAVSSSGGLLDAKRLHDGDVEEPVLLPVKSDELAWIRFSFAHPRRIQAITAVIGKVRANSGVPDAEVREDAWLETSDDGRTFRKIAELPQTGAPQQTVSFSPVTAREFRVTFARPPQPFSAFSTSPQPPPTVHRIAELALHTGARVNRFENKAGFATRAIVSADDTPPVTAADALQLRDIVDLTGRLRTDGSLDWTPPSGRWVVLRFGHSLTGKANHPASKAGAGLEVDKLNRVHVDAYMQNYLRPYEKILGKPLGQHGLRSLHVGSYEAGPQNWTDDMIEQFQRRRGYDLHPWLPVLAGRVVSSAAASDAFLWDFRQTLGDLIVEAHYEGIAAEVRNRGMQTYFESFAERRGFPADGMRIKQAADIPMGEMWVERFRCCDLLTPEVYDADVRESASVAHVYGRPLVAAESLTSWSNLDLAPPYSAGPSALKPTADRLLVTGVNRFILQISVHQPLDKPGPGITLGPFGEWLTRKETWAEQMGPWIDYLTRSAYLLQQGRFVADVAYLYGEGESLAGLFWNSRPPVTKGYNFDFINAQALLHELSVRDGLLVTRSGMSYRVLALDPSTARMSLPVLRKIRDLVAAGAVVVGAKPVASPSLADDQVEFQRIATQLWDRNRVGPGEIVADSSLTDKLYRLGIFADFKYTAPRQDADIVFTHRALEDGEIYFVNSRNGFPQTVEANFRITGKEPELWRADTGAITPLSYRVEKGRTFVPLELDPEDSVFVVFRRATTVSNRVVPRPRIENLVTLDGIWDVTFPPGLGAPSKARFKRLSSWSESSDPGIKYFSGTAVYRTTVQVQPQWLKNGSRLQLDLGAVKEVAEVLINGRSSGTVWKTPFRLDVTDNLRTGDNVIEIKVSNLWRNRLIGDKQPGAKPIAYATHDPFKADTSLLPSGLLGPVTLLKSDPSGE